VGVLEDFELVHNSLILVISVQLSPSTGRASGSGIHSIARRTGKLQTVAPQAHIHPLLVM
jgi:hypothetical protein